MRDDDEKIRSRAYELWERAGRTGGAEDYWYQAERELRESGQMGGAGAASTQPAEASGKRKSAAKSKSGPKAASEGAADEDAKAGEAKAGEAKPKRRSARGSTI